MINTQSSLSSPSSGSLSMGQDVYTDLTGLKKINLMADKDNSVALKELSKQFESIFINLMLKTMRESNAVFEEGGLFNSNEMKFHRESFDNQLALNLSNQGGIGLADAFYKQMERQYSDDDKPEVSIKPLNQEKPFNLGDRTNQNNLFNQDTFIESARPKNNASFEKDDIQQGQISLGQALSDLLTPATSVKTEEANRKAPELNKVPESVPFHISFETPQKFVDIVYPHAKKASEKLGIDPRVLVAQAALETGWGQHVVKDSAGKSSHNLFNIKADNRWDGDRIGVSTIEYRDGIANKESANFRQYENIVDSFDDYVDFIQNQPRYQQALQSTNPQDYLHSLQNAGYATDPHYADKVMRVFNGETIQDSESISASRHQLFFDNRPEG